MTLWEEEKDKSTRKTETGISFLFHLFHDPFHALFLYRADFYIECTNVLILPEQFFHIADAYSDEAVLILQHCF